MENKRVFPRLSKQWEIEYRSPGQHDFEDKPNVSRILDISGGGIGFVSPHQLPVGSLLTFELKSTIFLSPIIGVVRVVWSKKGGDSFLNGSKFVWVNWKDNITQSMIADYINSHIS